MMANTIGQGASKALLAFFNHVLTQHQWARDKLSMHVGRTVLIGLDVENLPKLAFLPPPEVRAQIVDLGLLEPLGAGRLASTRVAGSEDVRADKPSVEMRIKPSVEAMQSFTQEGPQGLLRHMRIEGDVLLAAALGEIASHARWDFEDDLSKVVGDISARRLGRLVEDSKFALQDGAQLLKGRGEMLRAEASFPLAERAALIRLDQQIADLGARLTRLEPRTSKS
jgi:ubiquinone biosynthesis accessory factor UbiJ